MRNVPISDLYPGMTVAEDVYIEGTSNKLISKGQLLSDKLITRLEFYSVFFVQIEDTQPPVVSEEHPSFSERVRTSEGFRTFSLRYTEKILLMEDTFNDLVKYNKPLHLDTLFDNTMNLLHTSQDSRISVFDMLTNLRSYDDQTYAHAVNVALISNVFAGWLGLSEKEVEMATLCGLLHDIGKLMIPEQILKKPAALTPAEYEIIKSHTVKGYQQLRASGVDLQICNAALMHHERYDGSGYPLGLEGDQITSLASLVSLADVYDAMTSARVYRGPLCPFQAISLIEAEGYQKYAPQYLLTFLENIVNTYLLNSVLLSDGREGKIIYINKQQLSAPTIKVGTDYVDLSQHPELSILKII